MAFRKQLPKPPQPTVREMVTKYGDQWYLFCASHPISSGVWQGDHNSGEHHAAIVMRQFEKGERDRVDEWDLRDASDRPPVQVEHVYPPIPERQWDYAAYRDPEPGHPVGRGRTPFEAINDLIEQESE
jgi:hypothetical protein